MKEKNKGFTLVEMVVVIFIFAILLGILVPSLNSILGFRVQRATNSIAAALDKTKIEASSRLVGEMKLEKRSDGYYISYILDRGKVNGVENISQNEDEEKIAPAKTSISYVTNGQEYPLSEGESIIITYDRATGSFLPLQEQGNGYWTDINIFETLKKNQSIFTGWKEGKYGYCEKIIVSGGSKTRNIILYRDTGKYQITTG